jgi:hypothetical protein
MGHQKYISSERSYDTEVCREFQQQLEEDPNFLSKVATGSIRLLPLPQDENQVEGAKI